MSEIRDLQSWIKGVIRRLLRRHGIHVDEHVMADLQQAAYLAAYRTIKNDSRIKPIKSVVGAVFDQLRAIWRLPDEYRLAATRRYQERVPCPCGRTEYKELRQLAIEHLASTGNSDQGIKDALVFAFWVDGLSLEELVHRCTWLKRTSVRPALIRIIQSLRARFHGDLNTGICLEASEVRRADRGTYRSRDKIRKYNQEYYRKNKSSRIASVNEARKKRQAANKVAEEAHLELLANGYARYALSDSEESAYYVHSDGFRVRVSNHPPRKADTVEAVESGAMVAADTRDFHSGHDLFLHVEAARCGRKGEENQ